MADIKTILTFHEGNAFVRDLECHQLKAKSTAFFCSWDLYQWRQREKVRRRGQTDVFIRHEKEQNFERRLAKNNSIHVPKYSIDFGEAIIVRVGTEVTTVRLFGSFWYNLRMLSNTHLPTSKKQ